MVYMAADNDLESAAISDYEEMMAVGSTNNVKIVVQLDRNPGTEPSDGYSIAYGSWTDCERFLVEKGSGPFLANAVESLGEVNMADPQTLKDFIIWCSTAYIADNYALILWNHGGGWRSRASRAGQQYAVCWDYTSNKEFLYNHEVRDAIEGAIEASEIDNLKLVGFDACQMQMLETVYELRGLADVVIGSEENEPGQGWPYTEILDYLVTSYSTATAVNFGNKIVEEYGSWYVAYDSTHSSNIAPDTTQSCFDMGKLTSVTDAVDALADWIMSSSDAWYSGDSRWSSFSDALNTNAYYGDGTSNAEPYHLDLYQFAKKLEAGLSSGDGARDKCDILMQAIEEGITARWAGTARGTTTVYGSYGLAIYCPPTFSQLNLAYNEASTFYPTDHPVSFVADHKWDDLLRWYYSPEEKQLPTGIEVRSIKNNVFHRGSGERVTVTFAVGESGKIDGYVFNVAADRVYTIPTQAVGAGDSCQVEWNGYNNKNKLVAPGVYILAIRLNDKYSTNPKVIVLP
jgi:clostripain